MSINVNTQKVDKPKFVKVKKQDRTYIYLDGKITFQNIVSMNVSKSGTHRLNSSEKFESGNTKKYVVLTGFKAIEFDAKDWTF